MERIIKFRAWTDSGMKYNIMPVNERVVVDLSSPKFEQLWEEFIYMQFTGLKDKNGKDIYEGDIVKGPTYSTCTGRGYRTTRTKEIVFQVKESLGYFGYGFTIEGHYDNNYRGMPKESDCEVIGNIYETPELLK